MKDITYSQNHRCKCSIDAGVRILKDATLGVHEGYKPEWWLYMIDFDLDYSAYHCESVAQICFCPFCGMRLEGQVQIRAAVQPATAS